MRSTVNRYGERNIDLVSGLRRERGDSRDVRRLLGESSRILALGRADGGPRAYPRFRSLQRPYDQLEEQMRLTIEGIKERQEWEIVNSKKFGLIHSVDPAMRISTR